MTQVLYTFDRRFMRKTVAAIDEHVDAQTAYLPLRSAARDSLPDVTQIDRPISSAAALDRAVAAVDPAVVVENHRFGAAALDGTPTYHRRYPVVHVRHGASVGRGEIQTTVEDRDGTVDVALAPGDRWARAYREGFDADVDVSVVGIPEADPLVDAVAPRQRRVLYAPTNHNYGGGSYLGTAERVLEVFADSDFDLRFRPHPADRREEPGASLTDRCRDRIDDLPNVTLDDAPVAESLLWADLLLSDYSGIVTEWLHTGRPLVQLTTLAAETTPPRLGVQSDRLTLATVEQVYESGYPEPVARAVAETIASLGIPMDGRAAERAAGEVMACTP